MKALFSLVSLVVVLCIVTLGVQHQLRASRLAAGSTSPGASAPGRTTPAQYDRDVHRALDAGMARRASQAETAEADH